ncbi:MAG: hypothetical protein LBE84_06925 [Planctomycetota bacterium]|nr:hypothetical protein [Planctomycetota bacterium]
MEESNQKITEELAAAGNASGVEEDVYTHTEVVFGLYGSSDGLRSFFVSGSDMKGQG